MGPQPSTRSMPTADHAEASDGASVQDPPDETIRALVTQMNTYGVGVIEGYLAQEDLAGLQQFVASAVAEAGDEYVVFNGASAVSGTLLERLSRTDAFVNLIRRVYEAGAGRPAPDQSLYQVLRCLAGESGQQHNFIFHFDSYVVTALLPITIPSSGRRGHLLMRPNLRKERPFYALNLIDKILLDNKLTQKALRYLVTRNVLKFSKVEMVPGNLYLFWGYRSLHTNEACDVGNLRATALYHFGDPHADSPLRQNMGRIAVQ